MVLPAGARLGPYEIVALIGAGGMGEVYRALDTRLNWVVAIKILPHDKLADANRKRRFLQEARAASALMHPNIVVIHDISTDSGLDFLVMEYVEGSILTERIKAGALPMRELVHLGTQIGRRNALSRERHHSSCSLQRRRHQDAGITKTLDGLGTQDDAGGDRC
jgi:eukaryotic-like serine/threonine-protein kinase